MRRLVFGGVFSLIRKPVLIRLDIMGVSIIVILGSATVVCNWQFRHDLPLLFSAGDVADTEAWESTLVP